MDKNIKILAYYLPQYHPIPENDEWWGKGFTEWTNVGKAKALFKGHYQPKVPADLGYYDLRLPEVRQEQTLLAKEAGVDAFCYWHYWFGNGQRLLENVFDEVLKTGKPDFPFCLAWANHSWFSKNWNNDGSSTNNILIEQQYPGIDDAKLHFDYLAKAFSDSRYVRVDDCPFLLIFDPVSIPEQYLKLFNAWAKDIGFDKGLYLVANIVHPNITKDSMLQKGFNAVTYQRLGGSSSSVINDMGRIGRGLFRIAKGLKGLLLHRPPRITDYRKYYKFLVDKSEDACEDVLPTIVPNWDHTPRSGWNGTLFVHATPEYFRKHVDEVLDIVHKKSPERRVVMLKSWNEWGEGNYMEPDLVFGKAYIRALRDAIDCLNSIESNNEF
ncbi:hypothetical protein Palpr_0404 [Paludibacter propionicigenes WB4]|uniref:Lipopolysaccharide biosynthesis protein-like protein n=1 Tax=Paludibacter propionicigenes (strain DSM 17365 / JCM 13257 / WB4) TaxID=694427 RepID=E4T1H0_PALPW|nr:glycoside hydrolase family 99-like domain-containing protein [Paludibacter propionicigenes]ADQ78564.1 hypothetical protein Palpr_0404 [Paludibacter propionicigenes WB4]